jgi:hypothetical protein
MHCSYPYGVDDHCTEAVAHIRTPPLQLLQLLLLLHFGFPSAFGKPAPPAARSRGSPFKRGLIEPGE